MNIEFWPIPELVDEKYRFDCHFCGKPCKVYEIAGKLLRIYSCECQQEPKTKGSVTTTDPKQ